MPTKDNATPGPGWLQPLFALDEAPELEEDAKPWPKENPYILGVDLANGPDYTAENQNFTVQEKQRPMLQALTEVISRVVTLFQSYPNKRVKHLALYAKKPRTRKKNMRRIARELRTEVERRGA